MDASVESIDGSSWATLLDEPAAPHKAAAYAQYPRCWPDGAHDPSAYDHMARCSDVDKGAFAFMGFSLRTKDYRYTEWAGWDGKRLAPMWNVSAGVELYDHRLDPPNSSKASFEQFENENALHAADPALVAALSKQLRAFFDAH